MNAYKHQKMMQLSNKKLQESSTGAGGSGIIYNEKMAAKLAFNSAIEDQ